MHPLGWVLIVLLYLCFNGFLTLVWVGTEKTNLLTVLVLMLAGLPIFAVAFVALIFLSGAIMVKGDYKKDKERRRRDE